MRIHCDGCGVQIDRDEALVMTAEDDGRHFYFCEEACALATEDPDPDQAFGLPEEAVR